MTKTHVAFYSLMVLTAFVFWALIQATLVARSARESEVYRAWTAVNHRTDIPFETWRTLYRSELLPVVPGTVPILVPVPGPVPGLGGPNIPVQP